MKKPGGDDVGRVGRDPINWATGQAGKARLKLFPGHMASGPVPVFDQSEAVYALPAAACSLPGCHLWPSMLGALSPVTAASLGREGRFMPHFVEPSDWLITGQLQHICLQVQVFPRVISFIPSQTWFHTQLTKSIDLGTNEIVHCVMPLANTHTDVSTYMQLITKSISTMTAQACGFNKLAVS